MLEQSNTGGFTELRFHWLYSAPRYLKAYRIAAAASGVEACFVASRQSLPTTAETRSVSLGAGTDRHHHGAFSLGYDLAETPDPAAGMGSG
jgi:hypothetical protein